VCTAVVTNNSGANLDMVMLDLGVPPGFTVLPDKLEALVAAGTLMKVELAGQQVILYIDKLAPKQALTVSYDLQAKFPVKAKAAGSSAYLYYDTATKAATGAVDFVVE
jgi:CD109 antigen